MSQCWNTLGLAIRVAQSIGFHVEGSMKPQVTGTFHAEQETMRRTWYSMYVLDRLLALQLGRPAAIHEEEYCVDMPSETRAEPATAEAGLGSSVDEAPAVIDYFVSVIQFSRIIGQVTSDLYRPSQVVLDPDQMLSSTARIDKALKDWKLGLPRHLRFDLGHTFERSISFRRQVRKSVSKSPTHLLISSSVICLRSNITIFEHSCIVHTSVSRGSNERISL